MKEKFKSPVLWLTMFTLIGLLLKTLFGWEAPPEYDKIVNCLLTLLISLGIINNPNDRENL